MTPHGSSLAAHHPAVRGYEGPSNTNNVRNTRLRDLNGVTQEYFPSVPRHADRVHYCQFLVDYIGLNHLKIIKKELYWNKNVAVLSQYESDGSNPKIIRTYTRTTEIKDCFWAKFSSDSAVVVTWLVILESRKGTFIAEDPTSNSITLEVEFPFPVIRGFPLSPVEGIVLNSTRLSQSDSPTPAVYLLKNPMEDILPIWMENANDPDRIVPPNGKVLHVGHVNKRSIIIMNDLKIYFLDKVTEEELEMVQHRNEEEHFGSISHFGTSDHIPSKSSKPGSRPMSTVSTPRTISPHPNSNSSKYRTPSSKKSTPNFTPRSKRTTNQSLLQGHRTPSSNRFKSFNQTGNTSSIYRKSAGNKMKPKLVMSLSTQLIRFNISI